MAMPIKKVLHACEFLQMYLYAFKDLPVMTFLYERKLILIVISIIDG